MKTFTEVIYNKEKHKFLHGGVNYAKGRAVQSADCR